MKLIQKEYKIRIMGKVKAKQSVKFGANGVKYTPSDMVEYANWVKLCFKKEYPDHTPNDLEGFYIQVKIYANFQYPKSFSQKKIKLAEEDIIKPAVKPDWDNISKNICDALNGIAYPDDRQIAKLIVEKRYNTDSYTTVEIGVLDG